MDYFNAFIGGAQIYMGSLAIQNARGEAELALKSSELEQMKMRHQAEYARIQGKDILAQADEDIQKRQEQVRQMIGAQKVSLAGQGIVIEGEIGKALESQEKKILREDQAAIRTNAWRQAFGLELKAQDFENQATYSNIEAIGQKGRILYEGHMGAARGAFSGAQSLMSAYVAGSNKKIPQSNTEGK